MAGVQLKFDSPSESSVDVDAALLGDDVDTMKKAIRELRRENEDLRAQLAKTQKEARCRHSRMRQGHRYRRRLRSKSFHRNLTRRRFDD